MSEEQVYSASIGTADDDDSSSSDSAITMLSMGNRADSMRRLQKLPDDHAIAQITKGYGFTGNVMNDALLTLSVSDESTGSTPSSAPVATAQAPSSPVNPARAIRLAPVFPRKIQPSADLENIIIGQTSEQLVQHFDEDQPTAMAGKNPIEFLCELSDRDAIVFGPTTAPDGTACDAKVVKVNVPQLQKVMEEESKKSDSAQSPESPDKDEKQVPVIDNAPDSELALGSSAVSTRVSRPLIGNICKSSAPAKKSTCQNRSFTFGGPGWCSPNAGKTFASEDVRLRQQELRKIKNAQEAKSKATAQAMAREREKGYDKSEAFDSHRDCQVGFGSITGNRGPLPPPAVLPSLARTNRTPLVIESLNPGPDAAPAIAPAPTIDDQLMDPKDLDPAPYMLTYSYVPSEDDICPIEPDFAMKWDPSVGVFHQTRKCYEIVHVKNFLSNKFMY